MESNLQNSLLFLFNAQEKWGLVMAEDSHNCKINHVFELNRIFLSFVVVLGLLCLYLVFFAGIDIVQDIPLQPEISSAGDRGTPVVISHPNSPIVRSLHYYSR